MTLARFALAQSDTALPLACEAARGASGQERSKLNDAMFDKGLQKRCETLGQEYVERNLSAADSLTRPFQEAMTAWCWGFGWGDESIDAKTRSMMNLAMLGALGKMHEWEIHCNGAINNGVTKQEMKEIFLHVAVYGGAPALVDATRLARKVWAEHEAAAK